MMWLVTLWLALAAPAFAEGPAPEGHAAEAGAEGGEHGGEHAHHLYTADDDGDGVPNWRDSTNGTEPNDETYVVTTLGYHAFNLFIFVGLIAFLGRRPIGDLLSNRALGVRKELADSARARDEAEHRAKELEQRLVKIEAEVEVLRTEAVTDAAAEEAKLIERAREEAVRIGLTSERNIRDEVTRAREALRRDAIELAVNLAETTLRQAVGSADQQRLAREFLESVRKERMNGHA